MPHNLTVDECLALLRDGSLKPESIAEEMECAGVTRPQSAQVQSARDALGKLETEAVAQTAGLEGPDARALAGEIAALPEMLALALVHAAGRASRQEVLRELATGPAKALAKEMGDDALAHQLAGAALFEDPLFMAWIPEEDPLRSFALKV